MSEAERYFRKAAECEQRAEMASDERIRETYLTAARSWRFLADTEERVRLMAAFPPPAEEGQPQAR